MNGINSFSVPSLFFDNIRYRNHNLIKIIAFFYLLLAKPDLTTTASFTSL